MKQLSGYQTSGHHPDAAIGLTISLTTDYVEKALFPGCGFMHQFCAKRSSDRKTIYWYQDYGAPYQFNAENVVYTYAVIG